MNPVAVQLARLSLWLTTLAADKPLNFLDHHLRTGDSLVGAALEDLARQPPSSGSRGPRPASALPLYAPLELEAAMRGVVPERMHFALTPDDLAETVHEKERRLATLDAPGSALARWKAAANLWCAGWFWTGPPAAPDRRLLASLTHDLLGRAGGLPAGTASPWIARARAIATERAFFHWTLEFPELFFDADGAPRPNPGFDAVIGNPPWDVIRADYGPAADRPRLRADGARVIRFVREAGIYAAQTAGHPNRYLLFVERSLSLLKRGGRLGLVLPSGLLTDQGAAGLRRTLFERCDTDTLVGFDNRDGVFPIHRSVRFVLLSASRDGATRYTHCRFGERDPASLDRIADAELGGEHFPVTLTPALLRRISGECCAVPDLRSRQDLEILERLSAAHRWLGDRDGWHATFGRELNATDDRGHFIARVPAGARNAPQASSSWLPVVEGKQIEPFRCHAAASRFLIPSGVASTLLDERRTFGRARLAYRDVASSTNRVTLIAAIVPRGVVTTHTLFCAKRAMAGPERLFLCAVLNSYVANYLVRQRIGTHLSAAIVERIPVPAIEAAGGSAGRSRRSRSG